MGDWGIEGFGEAADIRFGTTTVYLQGHLPGHQRETEAEDGDVFPPLPRKCWVHLGSSLSRETVRMSASISLLKCLHSCLLFIGKSMTKYQLNPMMNFDSHKKHLTEFY